jgi:photosystem II stability/assembly factor-like uncharacterized protein
MENLMKLFCLAAVLLGLCDSVARSQWQEQTIRSEADFRGLSAVSAQVAWISGTKGTYARTTDGGQTWSVGTVPGAAKLDFRDVEAFSATTAYLLSAGPGEDSRIYKTADGGRTWALQFKNPNREGFFDAIAFWDEQYGLALGDPVNGGEPWWRLQDVPTVAGESYLILSPWMSPNTTGEDHWPPKPRSPGGPKQRTLPTPEMACSVG